MSRPQARPVLRTVVLSTSVPGSAALVLFTPARLDGAEIEISRGDDPGARRTHAQVRPRRLPGQTRYAAVYQDLAAGRYTIWRDQDSPAAAVTVAGGQVTSCHWPD